MPELPEVQTIANILRDGGREQDSIVGEKVKKAEVFWHKTVEIPTPKPPITHKIEPNNTSMG